MDGQEKSYIQILLDSMKQKQQVLLNLYKLTEEQNFLLNQGIFDFDQFEQLLLEKEELILKLQTLDQGFVEIYHKVSEVFQIYKYQWRTEIQLLQELITKITAHGVAIQSLEKKNNILFQIKISEKKKEVKTYQQNSKTAASYYKNMANQHRKEDSYFLDQRK